MSTPSAPALPLLTAADLAGPTDVVIGDGGITDVEGVDVVAITIPRLHKRLILDAVAVVDLAYLAIIRARDCTDWSDAVHGAMDWRGLDVELYPTPAGAIRIRPAGMARGVPAAHASRWWTPDAA